MIISDLKRLDHKLGHSWHVAINRFSNDKMAHPDFPHFMYEAKDVADEVPRMALLFSKEREGRLATTHKQCSLSATEPVTENHLSCCLGKRCSICPYLLALDQIENATPEQIDTIKAWTCATHVLMSGGDAAKEGYLMTVDDRMYWDRVYEGMSEMGGDEEPGADQLYSATEQS